MDYLDGEKKCYECGRLKTIPFECSVCHRYCCGNHYVMYCELCDICFEGGKDKYSKVK